MIMETCTPHFRMKQNRKIGKVVLIKQTPQKKKRMYAVPNSEKYCPVKTLSDFISKTDPNASSLFNRCSKPALSSPNDDLIWYTDTPIKHYQFTRFMHDISKNEK